MRPPIRSSSRSISTCRWSASASSRAIPTGSRPAPAPAARARSRSAARRSNKATEILGDNLKQLASETLEAGIGDLEIVDGAVRIVGTDKALDLAAIARAARRDARPCSRCTRAGSRRRRPIRTAPMSASSRSIPDTGATEILELCRGRRFRRDAEPDHAAGPGPWRRGAGHRPGADGARSASMAKARC